MIRATLLALPFACALAWGVAAGLLGIDGAAFYVGLSVIGLAVVVAVAVWCAKEAAR